MSLEVIEPGVMTQVQDAGRYGFQHLGVTTGGPLDEHAFHWANRLLDNPVGAAALEVTYGLLKLRALAPAAVALTGADLGATLNGAPVAPWRSYALAEGDRLEFATPVKGLRAYLAVAGGVDTPARLGSRATVTREGLGGLDGHGAKLAAGDRLPCDRATAAVDARVPDWAIPDYDAPLCVGLMLGYQHRDFDDRELARLFAGDYRVSPHIDRMGYRLSGPAVRCRRDGIVSEGIAYGAVQIPADGQPIVLLRDRQTIGGYPKVGCLSALDAGQLAQRGPGAPIRFRPVDVAEAEAQRLIFNHTLGL